MRLLCFAEPKRFLFEACAKDRLMCWVRDPHLLFVLTRDSLSRGWVVFVCNYEGNVEFGHSQYCLEEAGFCFCLV